MTEKSRDIGLFILRLGLGSMFIYHGYPKITGGASVWSGLGMAIGNLGITFVPVFWGFMAAFSEFFGGICLILGLFFRPACALMFFTMSVAVLMHLKNGDGFSAASHAVECGIVFFSLIFTGPGSFSISNPKKRCCE